MKLSVHGSAWRFLEQPGSPSGEVCHTPPSPADTFRSRQADRTMWMEVSGFGPITA